MMRLWNVDVVIDQALPPVKFEIPPHAVIQAAESYPAIPIIQKCSPHNFIYRSTSPLEITIQFRSR
jgi:hypothetical protein